MAGILEQIVRHKREEIAAAKAARPEAALRAKAADAQPIRDFVAALIRPDRIGLIAEVKRASPSAGAIRADFDPVAIARGYEAGGAHCVSVLTDERFFGGRLDYLARIRDSVAMPVLRKDFVLDEYQVIEARAAGADAVLLIAECLPGDELTRLHDAVNRLGMTALVELYDPVHLDRVLACRPRLVGINNRDLNSFEVDLQHSMRMRGEVGRDIPLVAESGIATRADVRLLEAAGVDAMLVGESLMRQGDPAAAVRGLLGG